MRLFEAPFSSNLAPAISVQSEPSEIERQFIRKNVYEKIKILQTALINAKLYINIYVRRIPSQYWWPFGPEFSRKIKLIFQLIFI
jgi:hypothetical protein